MTSRCPSSSVLIRSLVSITTTTLFASFVVVALFLTGCKVGPGGGGGGGDPAGGEAAVGSDAGARSELAGGTANDGESAVQPAAADTATVGSAAAVATVDGTAATGAAAIGATTRRTSRGLPGDLVGYPSWYGLGAAPARALIQPERTNVRLYVRPSSDADVPCAGDTLGQCLRAGTVLVVESKLVDDGFVRRVDSCERTADGWVFRSFRRDEAEAGFVAVDESEGCPFCTALTAEIDRAPDAWVLQDT